jgi:diguanylate cyclase (GGDEF)-like protein/PAS domain S-box-containing protein
MLRQALVEGQGLSSMTKAHAALIDGIPAIEKVTLTVGETTYALDITFLPLADGSVLVLARDVTLDFNLRSALVDSRQRYKDLVEISSDFIWEVGLDGRFAFVSPKGALGFAADQLVGRYPDEFIVAERVSDRRPPFRATSRIDATEIWMRGSEGESLCLMASAVPILDNQGQWRGARGICRDITAEKVREAALARANNRERLLTYIVRTIRDVVDPSDMLATAAEATTKALGASGTQVFRINLQQGEMDPVASYGECGDHTPIISALLHGDHFEGELNGWLALGTVSRYRQEPNGALLLWRAPGQMGWTEDDRLLIADVSSQIGIANEQTENHERILRLSRTDALTGLFNRRAFFEEMERRFLRLERDRKPAALIYADLDNFKLVNDQRGHQVGDQALLAVRDLLLHHTRPVDLVARLGGDEFAIWLEGADERIAIMRCEALLEASASLKSFSGDDTRPLMISLGVAVHDPSSSETLPDLVARADQAMYAVKRSGKGSWKIAPV